MINTDQNGKAMKLLCLVGILVNILLLEPALVIENEVSMKFNVLLYTHINCRKWQAGRINNILNKTLSSQHFSSQVQTLPWSTLAVIPW